MVQIYPFYKGENIANNPLGYTTVANARKRMKSNKVVEDFEKTLPEDYWFKYLYTYQNGTREDTFRLFRREFKIIGYDITKQVYIKDIENEDVKNLFIELTKCYDSKAWYDRTDEEWDELERLSLEINKLGYHPHCWKDEKDYKKRYTKFVTENVEFKEMDVDVVLKDNDKNRK